MAGVFLGNVASVHVIKVTIDIDSVAINTTAEQDVTVPGVKTGDFVSVSKPSLEAGLIFGSCRVKADDTVSITIANVTGGAINEASEELTFLVVRPEAYTVSRVTA